MQSEHTQSGRGVAAAPRDEVFRDLRERNQRRDRVAKLARYEGGQDPWVENARDAQRQLKRRLPK